MKIDGLCRASSENFPRDIFLNTDIRVLDNLAAELGGFSAFEFMKEASALCKELIEQNWPDRKSVTIWAGGGNNAGDGYLLASLLNASEFDVTVIQIVPSAVLDGDAFKAMELARGAGIPFRVWPLEGALSVKKNGGGLWVDAMLGIGLNRPVEDNFLNAIDCFNDESVPKLSIDIPSGLCSNTGVPLGRAVKADATITFLALKLGLLTGYAPDYVGELFFSALKTSNEVFSRAPAPIARRIDIHDSKPAVSPRSQSAHKGVHGHTVLIGGDYNFGGAVILAAEAAVASGSGLVSIVTRSCHRNAFLARSPELMIMGTEDPKFNIRSLLKKGTSIIIGPGLGRSEWGQLLWAETLAYQQKKGCGMVVDADALRFLAEEPASVFGGSDYASRVLLTPHAGEASALLGKETRHVVQNRLEALREIGARYGANVVLKGNGSLIYLAPTDKDKSDIKLCSEGNAGMASAGMGDVLSGIAGAFLAQGLTCRASVCASVCVHGEAADQAAAEFGQVGLKASDLLLYIRRLLNF